MVTKADENQAFRREALVSWFLDHPNIQSFVGIDQTTFSPLLCIVSPWQQNGNILIWLTHCDTLGLPILVDEHVCSGKSHEDLLFTAHITDSTDSIRPGVPPR